MKTTNNEQFYQYVYQLGFEASYCVVCHSLFMSGRVDLPLPGTRYLVPGTMVPSTGRVMRERVDSNNGFDLELGLDVCLALCVDDIIIK